MQVIARKIIECEGEFRKKITRSILIKQYVNVYTMKNHFQILLAICVSLFFRTNTEQLYFGHRIRTDITSNELTFYAFEITPMWNIENCVESCKSKKQCKIINYDHRAKLCYHVASDSAFTEDFNRVDFLEKKPGFSYGVKSAWNMVRTFFVS
jgi:hypothetical protein